ncbi:hypothetical protein J8273_1542 [Carpediemonas membranifera]|uniref:Uncharacterized protein n=1 Tax=Carpediemonas membranifera TaxID=201153 RepID=A0A8J6BFR2_9EUKA|nr:hypothetical protein J8273_1542 [Carpediemonas membranifera]|eukprot:KAG9396537.1 hypothetical protein J8273_1542 [Carpediemonas membranifera]
MNTMQMNANQEEQLQNATASIQELMVTVQQLKQELATQEDQKRLEKTIKQLREESNVVWQRPASNTMKEETDFLENLYRTFKFGECSGYTVLSQIYLRHRVLWVKDHYGYLPSLQVATAGAAALAESPEMGPAEINAKVVLKTLAKNPHLKERKSESSNFHGAGKSKKGPKRL